MMAQENVGSKDKQESSTVLSTHIQAGYSTTICGDAIEDNGMGFAIDLMYSPKITKSQFGVGLTYQGNLLTYDMPKLFDKKIGKASTLSYFGLKIRYDALPKSIVRPYVALSFGKSFLKRQKITWGTKYPANDLIENQNLSTIGEWTECENHEHREIKRTYRYIGSPDCCEYEESIKDKYDRFALGVEAGVSVSIFTVGITGLFPKDYYRGAAGGSVYPLQVNIGIKLPIM